VDSTDSLGFGEVIHGYSRRQAIRDGFLVEVPGDVSRQAGFRVPVALTSAAWADCVAWSDEDNARKGALLDEGTRLWEVTYRAARAAGRARGGDAIMFGAGRVPREGRAVTSRIVQLRLAIGPGDTGEPVITIMLPDED
jgi:hypothetical protein